jgi:hypothetical protein
VYYGSKRPSKSRIARLSKYKKNDPLSRRIPMMKGLQFGRPMVGNWRDRTLRNNIYKGGVDRRFYKKDPLTPRTRPLKRKVDFDTVDGGTPSNDSTRYFKKVKKLVDILGAKEYQSQVMDLVKNSDMTDEGMADIMLMNADAASMKRKRDADADSEQQIQLKKLRMDEAAAAIKKRKRESLAPGELGLYPHLSDDVEPEHETDAERAARYRGYSSLAQSKGVLDLAGSNTVTNLKDGNITGNGSYFKAAQLVAPAVMGLMLSSATVQRALPTLTPEQHLRIAANRSAALLRRDKLHIARLKAQAAARAAWRERTRPKPVVKAKYVWVKRPNASDSEDYDPMTGHQRR